MTREKPVPPGVTFLWLLFLFLGMSLLGGALLRFVNRDRFPIEPAGLAGCAAGGVVLLLCALRFRTGQSWIWWASLLASLAVLFCDIFALPFLLVGVVVLLKREVRVFFGLGTRGRRGGEPAANDEGQ